MKTKLNFFGTFFWFSVLLMASCIGQDDTLTTNFTKLDPQKTGIDFENQLVYNRDFNIYTYRNFYNGGGVGIGDVNGDNLPDVFLTANMGPNKLFINEGDMHFRDVTNEANVAGTRGWSTGVSMADVNDDGYLDIYVCNSGKLEGDDRANELFINNGDGSFTERATEFGLADRGLSTHAVFFDYDRDGDLDMYLLNNSFRAITSFNLSDNQRPVRDSIGGDKLFRNDDGFFKDVSLDAGIYGSVIGFGLGVTVGDIDLDGWLDIYVSNDFFERDYLYINQKDGTFSEQLPERINAISAASMGADMADLTGDGYPEIFVTDMLPSTDKRLKMNTTFESWDNYVNKLEHGYYHQFTRNTLQFNRGDGTFSEVSRAFGTEASDWSWGALLVDLDSDGDRDVFVANGIYQDLTNQDFITFLSSEQTKRNVTSSGEVDFEMLIDLIPSEPVSNVVFENKGEGSMINSSSKFGLNHQGFSNGAAYGDLDNDGDLDLIVNNVNDVAWVYRNDQPRDSTNNSLLLTLLGQNGNHFAYGARVVAHTAASIISIEQIPNRGFQSSVDNRLFIGLGAQSIIDSLIIYWPNGSQSKVFDVPAGKLTVTEEVGKNKFIQGRKQNEAENLPYIQLNASSLGIDFKHSESTFVDFDRERLVYQMLSTSGPCIAVADVNGDRLEDFYIGGAKSQSGEIYVQQPNGDFIKKTSVAILNDARSEDVDVHFLDADNDGDQDLIVASGSSEFSRSSIELFDRLYLNDGQGDFSKASRAVWNSGIYFTSCISLGDADNDGDIDIFQGVRSRAGGYGVPQSSSLYINENGIFTKSKQTILDSIGMVSDAIWTDIDDDGKDELILTRDWGRPLVLSFEKNILVPKVEFTEDMNGWWTKIESVDIDQDGDVDLLLGNLGTNSRLKASFTEPVTMYVNDFDRNGTPEQLISRYLNGTSLPISLRHDVVMQMPELKKKYLKYDSYFGQRVSDMFDTTTLSRSLIYAVKEQRSGVLLNQGNNVFQFEPFSHLAQLSPIFGFQLLPKDHGILAGGNLYGVKPEMGRYDASRGEVIRCKDGNCAVSFSHELGIRLTGEIRDIEAITIAGEEHILAARNNDTPLLFRASSNAE